MSRFYRLFQPGLVAFLVLLPCGAYAQQGGRLTSAEVKRLRDAQDPSQRISVYLSIEQARLNRIDGLQDLSPQAQEQAGGQINEILQQYMSINEELQDWIQYQYDHDGDMRRGLHQLLSEGPRQLQQLQHFQNGPAAHSYSDSLSDAIAGLKDTLNGATEALAVQQKKFPETKRQMKAEQRARKKEIKEQAKRNKEEEKLNKKEAKRMKKQQHQKGDSADFGQN